MEKGRQKELVQFGQAIRNNRLSKDLSQEQLAHLCELDRTYIGGVERGERNISLINILKISKALKLRPGSLFSEFKE